MAKRKSKDRNKEKTGDLIKDIPIEKKVGVSNLDKKVLFSFEFLQENSYNYCEKADYFHKLLSRLTKLSQIEWRTVRTSGKHGFGTEKIRLDQIRYKDHPSIITKDMDSLVVFRASGDNRAMAGVCIGPVFYVIYLEPEFNDLYCHGSK